MVRIVYREHDGTEHDIDVPEGGSVMEGAVANDIDGIDAECGGSMICATCQVFVDEAWRDAIGPPSDLESDLLEYSDHAKPNARLSCQINVNHALDGMVVTMPESQR